jgi:hypothetical protein
MAERAHIPNSPACGQWETLLADALDGLLRPEDETTFASHMAVCPHCTAMFEEARRGREWLEFLSPEPEVPEGLLDKILAQTGPGQVAGYGLVTGDNNIPPMQPAWQRPGVVARIHRFAEPRLLMTAAMAFFSIALTLNLTGVRLSDLRLANLRPSAVRSFMERRLTMASTPIIRYYDHLRLVYEVQSRMRELRRTTQGEGTDNQTQQNGTQPTAPGESKEAPTRKDGGSRVDPPQQSVTPAPRDSIDYLETVIRLQDRPAHSEQNESTCAIAENVHGDSSHMIEPLKSINLTNGSPDFAGGGSALAIRERSTVWTA